MLHCLVFYRTLRPFADCIMSQIKPYFTEFCAQSGVSGYDTNTEAGKIKQAVQLIIPIITEASNDAEGLVNWPHDGVVSTASYQ